MGIAPETKLVVKHTFLEFISDSRLHKELRVRAQTDSALVCGLSDYDALSLDGASTSVDDETSSIKHCGSTEAPDGRREWALSDFLTSTQVLNPPAPWSPCCDAFGVASGDGWWMPTSYQVCGGIPTPYTQQETARWEMRDSDWPSTSSSPVVGLAAGACKTTDLLTEYVPDFQTTVMLRNLPNNYTRRMLLELIDSEGFAGLYDFVYLPIDFNSQAGLGYAFVNLLSPLDAQRFWKHFDGFSRWVLPSDKVCLLNWSSPHQGLADHIERYRNSPVMHDSVSDECRPMIFADGVRIQFPPPTRQIKVPRLRTRGSAKFPQC